MGKQEMGKISVQEFVKRYNQKSVDFDKQYGAQCVDLFNFYNTEVVGAPFIGTPITMGARDLYEVDSKVRNEHYKRLAADSQLQTGDVLVYGPPQGRYIDKGVTKYLGHVNIYIGDNQVIQQNAKWNQKTTIDPLFTGGVIGVLRPLRFINSNSPQDVPTDQQNKNKHKIVAGDTFWGLEDKKGWNHGTLQTLNPELNPISLTIGSYINTPGESTTVASTPETYYVIKAGDTLWGLEDAWQLAHGTLQNLNPGVKPRELAIGQRIRRS